MPKGRNKKLIELRNKKLIQRYHYWYDIKRLRPDDVIRKLSEQEFFLSTQTIERIILENRDYLERLRENDK